MRRAFPIAIATSTDHIFLQSVRRYATEGPSSGSGSKYGVVATVAAVAGAGGYYYSNQMGGNMSLPTAAPLNSKDDSGTQNKGKPANSAFLGGDQGWIDLKLESVEELSHNTKKFRFALPNEDDVSGLHIACMFRIAGGDWLAIFANPLRSCCSHKI